MVVDYRQYEQYDAVCEFYTASFRFVDGVLWLSQSEMADLLGHGGNQIQVRKVLDELRAEGLVKQENINRLEVLNTGSKRVFITEHYDARVVAEVVRRLPSQYGLDNEQFVLWALSESGFASRALYDDYMRRLKRELDDLEMECNPYLFYDYLWYQCHRMDYYSHNVIPPFHYLLLLLCLTISYITMYYNGTFFLWPFLLYEAIAILLCRWHFTPRRCRAIIVHYGINRGYLSRFYELLLDCLAIVVGLYAVLHCFNAL